ncbi:O-antigen/teichoic acid export membrane protein [Pantoea ananatis]|nr:O-antigen/teichoic acid export membrane protein [Pantoea ananatis]MDR6092156.1 O-antigen/teichoic acid export membrane protein [Pantoea ananatis]
MSTLITAVVAVIYTLIAIGHFIWAIVVAYRGLTWLLTNFDDLIHIWKRNWRFHRRFILRRIWKRIFSH